MQTREERYEWWKNFSSFASLIWTIGLSGRVINFINETRRMDLPMIFRQLFTGAKLIALFQRIAKIMSYLWLGSSGEVLKKKIKERDSRYVTWKLKCILCSGSWLKN
jgi:hypothetical protein